MKKFTYVIALLITFAFTATAFANIKQLKTYREVYPDYKPKCIYCHVSEKPKKEDGQNDLNAYGFKLQELMAGEALTADMIESAGDHENFEAEEMQEPVTEEGTDETSMNEAIEELGEDVAALSETVDTLSETVEELSEALNTDSTEDIKIADSQK